VVQPSDRSAETLVYYRPSGDMRYRVQTTPDQWANTAWWTSPLFIGGDPPAGHLRSLQYGAEAQARNIQGQVTVAPLIRWGEPATTGDGRSIRRRPATRKPARVAPCWLSGYQPGWAPCRCHGYDSRLPFGWQNRENGTRLPVRRTLYLLVKVENGLGAWRDAAAAAAASANALGCDSGARRRQEVLPRRRARG
jgi:hypothetical protein